MSMEHHNCSLLLSNDGDIVSIGAYGDNGSGIITGHVRIYEHNDTSWNILGYDISGDQSTEYTGWSVDMDNCGSIIAIGAYMDVSNSYEGYAEVYSYTSSTNSWDLLGSRIDSTKNNEARSINVSLDNSGNTISVSTCKDISNGFEVELKTYIYSSINDSWTQLGNTISLDISGDYELCKHTISSNGRVIAINAYSDKNTQLVRTRNTSIYSYISSTGLWEKQGTNTTIELTGGTFDYTVKLSNETIYTSGDFSNNNIDENYTGETQSFATGTLLSDVCSDSSLVDLVIISNTGGDTDTNNIIFVLDELSVAATMGISAEVDIDESTFSADAQAIIDVSTSIMKQIFQFKTTSKNINDLLEDDIQYKHNEEYWDDLCLNITNSELQRSKYPVYTNSSQVKHDFMRHIANELFNTHYAVDLFANEKEMLTDICNNISHSLNTEIKTLLAYNGSSYDSVDTSYNFSKKLLFQMVRSQVGTQRISNLLDDTSAFQSIPFKSGDEVQIRVVLKSVETQSLLVSNTTTQYSRSYIIRLLMN